MLLAAIVGAVLSPWITAIYSTKDQQRRDWEQRVAADEKDIADLRYQMSGVTHDASALTSRVTNVETGEQTLTANVNNLTNALTKTDSVLDTVQGLLQRRKP